MTFVHEFYMGKVHLFGVVLYSTSFAEILL